MGNKRLNELIRVYNMATVSRNEVTDKTVER